jgi:hypothetical protein
MLKLLLSYDGSECSEKAADDLKTAGLPEKADAVVLTVAENWIDPACFAGYLSYPYLAPSGEDIEGLSLEQARSIADRGAAMLLHSFPKWKVRAEAVPGAENLRKSELLKKIIEKAKKSGAWIAAICASPAVVLSPLGILDGKRATCYPGFENQLNSKISFSTDRVVTDGLVITSRGPGTALEFSLEIVNRLAGPEKAAQLASQVIAK